MTKKTFIGKGKVWVGPYDDSAKKYFVGNVSSLVLNFEEQEQNLPDYTASGGGDYDSLTRISSVSADFTLHDIIRDNLAAVLRGSGAAVVGGAVSAEAHAHGWVGGLVRTANNIDLTQTVTVTGPSATPAYTEGTHFQASAAGIEILSLPGGASDGDGIEVTYTSLDGNLVQVLTAASKLYKVTFDGLNEAESDAPAVVDLLQYRMGVAASVPLIGDDFLELPVTGKLLKDTAITTAGLSQYARIEYV